MFERDYDLLGILVADLSTTVRSYDLKQKRMNNKLCQNKCGQVRAEVTFAM